MAMDVNGSTPRMTSYNCILLNTWGVKLLVTLLLMVYDLVGR
jgi:hypothetical protein